MAIINLNLELDLNRLETPKQDGLELPSYASDILLKLLSQSIHTTLHLHPEFEDFKLRAQEERGYRKALIEFAQHFTNPELPK